MSKQRQVWVLQVWDEGEWRILGAYSTEAGAKAAALANQQACFPDDPEEDRGLGWVGCAEEDPQHEWLAYGTGTNERDDAAYLVTQMGVETWRRK